MKKKFIIKILFLVVIGIITAIVNFMDCKKKEITESPAISIQKSGVVDLTKLQTSVGLPFVEIKNSLEDTDENLELADEDYRILLNQVITGFAALNKPKEMVCQLQVYLIPMILKLFLKVAVVSCGFG